MPSLIWRCVCSQHTTSTALESRSSSPVSSAVVASPRPVGSGARPPRGSLASRALSAPHFLPSPRVLPGAVRHAPSDQLFTPRYIRYTHATRQELETRHSCPRRSRTEVLSSNVQSGSGLPLSTPPRRPRAQTCTETRAWLLSAWVPRRVAGGQWQQVLSRGWFSPRPRLAPGGVHGLYRSRF